VKAASRTNHYLRLHACDLTIIRLVAQSIGRAALAP
jgi:hypothetical protein